MLNDAQGRKGRGSEAAGVLLILLGAGPYVRRMIAACLLLDGVGHQLCGTASNVAGRCSELHDFAFRLSHC